MITLLSPAKNNAVARAAIQAGADAVYIGGPAFGARQAAANSIDDLQQLTQYAHQYGVQVLVTLNTLLTPHERKEAAQIARQLYQIGVDALIIQDLNLLDEDLPPIRLHASTQCDNRSVEQVQYLQQRGFQRVVLARELNLQEIQAIHEAVPDMELEAFIHGALCVSYSGKCYISEVLQNRSANRGQCAQLCRMRYDLLDANRQEVLDSHGQPVHQRYVLSLQDMQRDRYIREMIEAGISTFKIEGRLKDADYVTNLTAFYRQRIDAVLQTMTPQPATSALNHRFTYSFTPDPERTFHRGATDYFLHQRTRPMASWQTPKSTGQRIGEVVGYTDRQLRVRLLPYIQIQNGDGLCVGEKGFAVNGVANELITPNVPPRTIPIGALYRNLDTAFRQSLHAERRVLVDIEMDSTEQGYRLTYKRLDNLTQITRQYDAPHEPAQNIERARQTIINQLGKLGDTIFAARNITVNHPYFLPISLLNQWRRDLTAHL